MNWDYPYMIPDELPTVNFGERRRVKLVEDGA